MALNWVKRKCSRQDSIDGGSIIGLLFKRGQLKQTYDLVAQTPCLTFIISRNGDSYAYKFALLDSDDANWHLFEASDDEDAKQQVLAMVRERIEHRLKSTGEMLNHFDSSTQGKALISTLFKPDDSNNPNHLVIQTPYSTTIISRRGGTYAYKCDLLDHRDEFFQYVAANNDEEAKHQVLALVRDRMKHQLSLIGKILDDYDSLLQAAPAH